MRKFFAFFMLVLGVTAFAQAEYEYIYVPTEVRKTDEEAEKEKKDKYLFNHWGLSVGVGTTGISADLGFTFTRWFQIRGGVDIMPNFKLHHGMTLKERFVTGNRPAECPSRMDINLEGVFKNNLAHVALDYFPFTRFLAFHISVGAYFNMGDDPFLTAYSTDKVDELKQIYLFNNRKYPYQNIPGSAGKIGAALGSYFFEPDDNGKMAASIKSKKNTRLYAGIGFGRTVPKNRLNFNFDLGAQFWGTPEIMNDNTKTLITENGAANEDKGVIKFITKLTVFPVLTFKLTGRIF